MRRNRIGILGFCIVLAATAANPLSSAGEGGRLFGYVGWDRDYFYFAAKVDDQCVVGVNDRPLSEPWQDDSVELCFDIAAAGGEAPTPACARLALSAVGGFTALVGTADGTWKADPSWALGLRFDATVQGTLNKTRDKDVGYIVEVAVPWRFLGGMPQPGSEIGFNVVCRLRGEQEGFATWSPGASVPSDLDRPSAWGRLVFESQARAATAEGAVIQCPRLARGSAIDGKLSPVEWMSASVLHIELPQAPPAVRVQETARSTQIMALYFPVTATSGLVLAQPRDGLGPWWKGDSVQWHRRQARDARLAGIDTLAVAYGASGRKPEASKSLACLVQALKDLKAGRYTYPLLALYLEQDVFAAGQSPAFWYDVIREFFVTVPPEFRAQAQVGNQRAHIVLVGPPAGAAAQGNVIEECAARFRRDFPGRSLLWLGDEGWKEKGGQFGGYWSRAPGLTYQASDRMRVATISPRTGGTQDADYEGSWIRLVSLGPDFVLINSWNNFADGTQICPSRQYGLTIVDTTRRYASQLAARNTSKVSLRRDTVPDVMAPGEEYQVELLLENNGFSDLTSREGINFEYELENVGERTTRITRDAARALRIPAGATVPVTGYVSTGGKKEPLPAGEYLLRFRVSSSKVPILTSPLWQKRLAEFVFPVQIGRVPPLKGTIVSSTVPTQMQAGEKYSAELHMRNDGSAPWKRGQVRVMYRWVGAGEEALTSATRWQEAGAVDVPADLAPGQMTTARLSVTASAQAGGAAEAGEGSRFLEWALARGGQAPVPIAREAVRIVKWDSGLRLTRVDVPRQMAATNRYEALVTLGNVGPSAWKANDVRVTHRWYHLDGAPAPGTDAGTPLPVDTAPGKLAVARIGIQAPSAGGTYLLGVDADFQGRGLASESDGAGKASFEPFAITVTGGRFEPIDLTEHLNATATTTPARRSAGDFDGAGRSLPAEQMPPDLSVAERGWYPCGYYSGDGGAPREVPFLFPKPERGVGRCLACAGQRVPLPTGPIIRLHLIAAATQPREEASFAIWDATGQNRSVALPIAYWLEAPKNSAEIGFHTPYLRAATNDEPATAYLRHYVLEAAGAVALELPKDPRVKVLALTVEREQPRQ